MEKKKDRDKIEILLWSIALPGFGQLLNRKYIKAAILIGLEFLINVLGNVNQVILLSFNGQIEDAISQANYLWVMFYPCVYFFSIWDAYKDAGGGVKQYDSIPLAFCAYIGTIAVIFSPGFTFKGVLFGPVWLMLLSIPFALLTGYIVKSILLKMSASN